MNFIKRLERRIDKKEKIGLPIQCTGLLTKDLEKIPLLDPKKDENKIFLVNVRVFIKFSEELNG